MNVFIRAMVRIFSFGERWNVLFNSAIVYENILTIALINMYIRYLYSITIYYATEISISGLQKVPAK